MASALYTDVKRKEGHSIFIRPHEGLFGLREWADKGLVFKVKPKLSFQSFPTAFPALHSNFCIAAALCNYLRKLNIRAQAAKYCCRGARLFHG